MPQSVGCCYNCSYPEGQANWCTLRSWGYIPQAGNWDENAWCPRKCEHQLPAQCQAQPADLSAVTLLDPLIPGLPAFPLESTLRALSSCYWPCRCLVSVSEGVAGYILPVLIRKRPVPGRPHVTSLTQSPQRSGAACGRLLVQGE